MPPWSLVSRLVPLTCISQLIFIAAPSAVCLRILPSLSMVLSQSIPTSELHRVLAGVMGVSLTPIIKSLSKPYRSPLVPSTGCYKRSDGDSLISHLTLTLYLVLGDLSSQIDTTLYLFPSITSSPYTLRGRVVTG